jgi:hypothetical protein
MGRTDVPCYCYNSEGGASFCPLRPPTLTIPLSNCPIVEDRVYGLRTRQFPSLCSMGTLSHTHAEREKGES